MAKLREILFKNSWMRFAGVFILYALAVLAILYPFLFQGFVFYGLDISYQHYAFYQFFADAIKSGESFLWNPYIFSGFPSYLSQTGMLDPVYWILIPFFDPILAVHWRLFIAYFSALLLSYLAGRAYGFSALASFLLGFAYLTAFSWRLISDPLVANGIFLLPWLFYAFAQAIKFVDSENRWKRWLWSGFGGVGIGWAFLSSFSQGVIYDIFIFAVFVLLYFLFLFPGKKNISSFTPLEISPDATSGLPLRKSSGFLTGFTFYASVLMVMAAVGFLIAAPHILPALKFIPLTFRAEQLPYEVATIKSVGPGDLIGFLFPAFSYFPYLSPGLKYLYVGAFWFFLAVMGLFYRFRSKIIYLFAALFGFAFIASLKWSPLFLLMWYLPVFNKFRAPYRWIQAGVFFLAVLGAYGFDNLENAVSDRRVKKILLVLGSVVGCITLAVLLLNFAGNTFWHSAGNIFKTVFAGIFYGRLGFSKDLAHYQTAFERGIGAWKNFTSLADPQFVLPFLLVVAGFGVIAAYVFGWIRQRAFRVAGSALVVLGFVGLYIVQWPLPLSAGSAISSHRLLLENIIPPSERMIYRTYPFMLANGFVEKRPPTFQLTPEENRILGEFQYASGWPNANMYARAVSVDGYDLLASREYISALFLVGSGYGGVELAASTDTVKQELFLKHIPLLGMMGGKYIISGLPLKSPELTLVKEERVTVYDLPIYIYENSTALPRVYLAEKVVELPGVSIKDIVNSKGQNFKHYTYLDCQGCTDGKPAKISGGNLGVRSLKNGLFDLVIDTKDGRWVVVSESFLPGWQATVDGVPAALVRANGLYMAIFVPAGEHSINIHYDGILSEMRWLNWIRGIISF